jgi:hypothetical protein
MKKVLYIFLLILSVVCCSKTIENTLFTIKDGKIKKIGGEIFEVYISSDSKFKDFVMLKIPNKTTFFMKREIIPIHNMEWVYVSKKDNKVYSLYHVFRDKEEDKIEKENLDDIESCIPELDLDDMIFIQEVLIKEE